MTLSPTAQTTDFQSRPTAPKLALRVIGSAVFAFAMAYRNVAIAGPSNKDVVEPMPAAPYSAPRSDGDSVLDDVFETADAIPADSQSLVVVIDHLQRVSFDEPIKTVLVGNPAIADVTMISSYEAVVTAKSVGATNLFFLDVEGKAIGDYDVVVREGEERRVVLRRGPSNTELFQCAPRCERTLSQIDTAESYNKLNEIVARENSLLDGAASNKSNAAEGPTE